MLILEISGQRSLAFSLSVIFAFFTLSCFLGYKLIMYAGEFFDCINCQWLVKQVNVDSSVQWPIESGIFFVCYLCLFLFHSFSFF